MLRVLLFWVVLAGDDSTKLGQFHKVNVEANGALEAVLGKHLTLFEVGLVTIHNWKPSCT